MRSCLCATLLCAAMAAAQSYEAASVKLNVSGSGSSSTNGSRGQIVFTNVSLKNLIVMAFDVKPFQVIGPGWLDAVRVDISAKLPPDTKAADRPLMLRALLEDRFQLAVHKESKEMTGYAMVVAKNGFKLQPVAASEHKGTSTNSNDRVMTLKATNISMANFAATLSHTLGAPVVERTAIPGVYDLEVKWNIDDRAATSDADAPPSLFTALQETLGLRLQSQKVPVEMIVVDRVERTPTEN